jgi:hypothetical protein
VSGPSQRGDCDIYGCRRLSDAVLDRTRIGFEFPTGVSSVERGRIKLFALAIGETDPVYSDLTVARQRGYRDIPIPPTYLYTLELEREPAIDIFAAVGANMGRVLHGEQSLHYVRDICAGDELSFQTRVADIFIKRGGKLEFFILSTRVTNPGGDLLAELRTTLIEARASLP